MLAAVRRATSVVVGQNIAACSSLVSNSLYFKHSTTKTYLRTVSRPRRYLSIQPFAEESTSRVVEVDTLRDGLSEDGTVDANISWLKLNADVAQGCAEGEFSLANGEVVFEQRSSSNLTYKIRVLRHSNQKVNADSAGVFQQHKPNMLSKLKELHTKDTRDEAAVVSTKATVIEQARAVDANAEKVIYEFQAVYDAGDDYNDSEIATTKALVQRVPESVDALHPGTCALLSSLVFCQTAPHSVLLLSSWGGSVAHYLAKKLDCDVHIVDKDLIAREAAREVCGFTPVEEADVPVNPFDVVCEEGSHEDISAAVSRIMDLNTRKGSGRITIGDKFTDAETYLSCLFSGASQEHRATAEAIIAERKRYEAAKAEHARLTAERDKLLDQSNDPAYSGEPIVVPPAVPPFTFTFEHKDHPFSQFSSALLSFASSPVRGFDMIVQDTEAYPGLSNERFLRQCKAVLSANATKDGDFGGVFVRRMTIAPAACNSVGPFAAMDMESVNTVLAQLKQVFTHVYVGQPSIDNVVIVATDNHRFSDGEYYPVSEERLVDSAVALWEQNMMTLEVLEKVDCFIEYVGQDIEKALSDDPDTFVM